MPTLLSNDACYTALASRDARFDGQFFVAVKSTGIYCRPICRVRLPAKKNCSFFESVVQAESAGYRPCLRCRPELVAGSCTAIWCTEGISESLAAHAIQLLDENFTELNVIELVSDKLGVSDRHLRRLLREHLGVSPVQYVQTRRLLLAKQLLSDTDLLVQEISAVAGFGSVRRFNTLLKSSYGMTPSMLRKSRKKLKLTARADSMAEPSTDTDPGNSAERCRTSGLNLNTDDSILCQLSVITPYDFSSLLAFHARRAATGLEWVKNGVYARSIELESPNLNAPSIGWYRIQAIDESRLQLEVSKSLGRELAKVIAIVRAQFDLDANPHHWLPSLGAMAHANPGLRVPGGAGGFEISVRAILGQQVTVAAATTLVSRIVEKFGGHGVCGGPGRTFPSAKTLAHCASEELGRLGIIKSRVKAIQSIAQAFSEGSLNLNPGADVVETRTQLLKLPGVGEWTTNYLLMRALRWPDAFIGTDLGIVKAAKAQGIDNIEQHAERWKPWRSYAAMHLWQSLEKKPEAV